MTILTLELRGDIAVMTINRPEALNALGREGDGDAVAAVCAEVNGDNSIRAAILTGAGPPNCCSLPRQMMRPPRSTGG